jgi:hypothetical protein
MSTRRGRYVAASVAAALAVVVGVGVTTGQGSDPAEPQAPIPRVCWFSDYDNARLSNQCTYDARDRRWYMEVDGRRAPADEQELPVANLCHYFAGQECPTGRSTR